MSESVIIKSVDRALDVMIYLYNQKKECSVTEIASAMDVYKSTIFRTLATLENKGFVKQNPENEKYDLGPQLYIIASSVNSENLLVDFIAPYAKELNMEFNECINISILDQNYNGVYSSTIIHKEKSKHSLNTNDALETQDECYCSAVGKCLLAYNNVDLSIYKKFPMIKYTENTIIDIPALEKELEKIRNQGYALDNEERELGMFCMAVPIFMDEQIVASMSISGAAHRMTGSPEKFLIMLNRLKEQGKIISENISITNTKGENHESLCNAGNW